MARKPGVEHLAMFRDGALVAAQRLEMLAHIALRQDMEPFEEIDRDRLPRSLQQREVERAIEGVHAPPAGLGEPAERRQRVDRDAVLLGGRARGQIGRASCRESVWQYV